MLTIIRTCSCVFNLILPPQPPLAKLIRILTGSVNLLQKTKQLTTQASYIISSTPTPHDNELNLEMPSCMSRIQVWVWIYISNCSMSLIYIVVVSLGS